MKIIIETTSVSRGQKATQSDIGGTVSRAPKYSRSIAAKGLASIARSVQAYHEALSYYVFTLRIATEKG